MSSVSIQAIVLAAGRSSRFNTDKSKLLHAVCGQELILYPITLLSALTIPITVVVGHQHEQISSLINEKITAQITYAFQNQPQGTGHAVSCAQSFWNSDHILIMNGDMPLIKTETISTLIQQHITNSAAVSFIIAHHTDPSSNYGRIVKKDNHVSIVEARHFTDNIIDHPYINAGVYIIKRAFLEQALHSIEKNAITGEWYLTDLIYKASSLRLPVSMMTVDFDQVRGVNSLQELWTAEHIQKSMLITQFMQQGVRFLAPQTVILDKTVHIGSNSVIGQGVMLTGNTSIGKHCTIENGSMIHNSIVEDNSSIHAYSVIEQAHISTSAHIGPFAHIRKNSFVGHGAHIGNFVEVSQSSIGSHSKAKHLAYIGTATIGNNVNIGAGTITCNYNGFTKNKTIVKDKAFIGSNSSLIAPVTIGSEAIIGAGSVITKDVPDNALALERSQQIVKENYAVVLKTKSAEKSYNPSTKDEL